MKLLKSSYFEKIDVIYIDPPYNTGNDFVYNDKYKMSKSEYDESIENSNIKIGYQFLCCYFLTKFALAYLVKT